MPESHPPNHADPAPTHVPPPIQSADVDRSVARDTTALVLCCLALAAAAWLAVLTGR